jgi:2-oxoisovalerate dehydrogenase E1 component
MSQVKQIALPYAAFGSSLQRARGLAEDGLPVARRFLEDERNYGEIECALRIRAVETCLYGLFGRGKLHGTIHTCIGQEFSGVLSGKHLRAGDFVTSSHRCHGHFVAATGQWRGLIDEIIGNADGVCAGIGSSQHLWAPNFISNGPQGGLLPVAAGIALDRKEMQSRNVVVSFIGEGTLGEGIVYETMNLDALWELPHVVVCENNFYSQSTPQESSIAGSILERAAAFGLTVLGANTWDLAGLDQAFAKAFEGARSRSQPAFIAITTYRLNPHSKGDDLRDKAEIEWFRARDPVSMAISEYDRYGTLYRDMTAEVASYAENALAKPALSVSEYFGDQLPRMERERWAPINWAPVIPRESAGRVAQQLNEFYRDWLDTDPSAVFIGEDIEDPYGGAFKIAKGLTTAFPSRARTTPISEAGITGLAIGLALCGRRAFVEIMFGDFITYAFDQIVNNAAKFYHMYNRNVSCPVVVRTPMGGRRGYGPTHSQSLERFLVGIDNCCTVSLNSLIEIERQLSGLAELKGPTILLENKTDYTLKTYVAVEGFVVESDDALLPTVRIRPEHANPTVTIVSFGGMARYIAERLIEIFEMIDAVPELLVPTCIHPLNAEPIAQSVRRTGRIAVIEEGAVCASVGAEVLSQLHEQLGPTFQAVRQGCRPLPIPSAPSLEDATLPSSSEICRVLQALVEKSRHGTQ